MINNMILKLIPAVLCLLGSVAAQLPAPPLPYPTPFGSPSTQVGFLVGQEPCQFTAPYNGLHQDLVFYCANSAAVGNQVKIGNTIYFATYAWDANGFDTQPINSYPAVSILFSLAPYVYFPSPVVLPTSLFLNLHNYLWHDSANGIQVGPSYRQSYAVAGLTVSDVFSTSLAIPNDPSLIGQAYSMQALRYQTSTGLWILSNGQGFTLHS